MKGWRLVADVGGTNVRFACADEAGHLECVSSRPSDAYPSFAHALQSYLEETTGALDWSGCAIGAAGPVEGAKVTLTKRASWSIDAEEVSSVLAGAPVTIVNDLQAVAAALPYLQPEDVEMLGGPAISSSSKKPMLAVNVGTGFGASLVTPGTTKGAWRTHPSEAGHMTLTAATMDELELLGIFQPGSSIESVLSGSGLCRLYQHLSGNADAATAAEIFAHAERDPTAKKVVRATTNLLARVAGDLVLATGAWGGVYFCGSVASGWVQPADPKQFRFEFESKGAMQIRMKNVPSRLIVRRDVALFGLARLDL